MPCLASVLILYRKIATLMSIMLMLTAGVVTVAGAGLTGLSFGELYRLVDRAVRHPVPLTGVLTVEEATSEGWTTDRYAVHTYPDGQVTTEVERSSRLPRGLRIREIPGGDLEVRLPGILGALPIRVTPTDPRALTRQGFRASDVTPVALAKALLAQVDRLQRGVRSVVPEGLVGVHLPSTRGLPPGVDGAEAGVAPDGTVRWGCLYRGGEPVYRFRLMVDAGTSNRAG